MSKPALRPTLLALAAAALTAVVTNHLIALSDGGPLSRVEERFHLTGLDRNDYRLAAAGYGSLTLSLKWTAYVQYLRKDDPTGSNGSVTVRVERPFPFGPWRLAAIER